MRTESGQATVEAALTFPVVLIALLLIVQVGIVVRDALALTQAAREGVRTAAITASDDRTVESIRRAAGPLAFGRIEIDIDPGAEARERGEPVSVRLRYTERLRIPIVSRIVDMELPLRATATMRLERGYAESTPRPP
ncbi:MAG: TadE family protein [Actinomycetota bacterium]